jgi:membrane protease YdiL (CAAX protease family)
MQGRLKVLGGPTAVVSAALAHTVYKCALFALRDSPVEIDFAMLAIGTLAGGLVFGALREGARSVWPAVAAHAFFDVVAYGDLARAPWWVWS